jgi:hypothetical protein
VDGGLVPLLQKYSHTSCQAEEQFDQESNGVLNISGVCQWLLLAAADHSEKRHDTQSVLSACWISVAGPMAIITPGPSCRTLSCYKMRRPRTGQIALRVFEDASDYCVTS